MNRIFVPLVLLSSYVMFNAVTKPVSGTEADACIVDEMHNTGLHISKSAETTAYLISKGHNVNARNKRKQTPLHLVDDAAIARLLVDAKAELDPVCIDGYTPLLNSIYIDTGDTETKSVFDVLVEAGANIHFVSKDNLSGTALHCCRSLRILKKVLALGVDPNQLNSHKQTVLFRLQDFGDDIKPAIKLLVDAGIKLDTRDIWGNLAIDEYSRRIQEYMIKLKSPPPKRFSDNY